LTTGFPRLLNVEESQVAAAALSASNRSRLNISTNSRNRWTALFIASKSCELIS
jgi:hypothetical protein